jgi:8-oxo-dGTP pyrophosphatase MutT (NUDIX family)
MAPLAATPNPTASSPAALRPRPAASLVIIDRRDSGVARILMGRRPATQVFLPNKYVFPGGRVERADHSIATSTATDRSRLIGTMPYAATAIRETFEETGLIIGQRLDDGGASTRRRSATWSPFYAHGFQPNPETLTLFARAITPPGRPRRYDTRFFWTLRQHVGATVDQTDGELQDLSWLTIKEARTRDLASITHHILNDLESLLNGTPNDQIPLYRQRRNQFERVLLSHQQAVA